MKRRVALWMIMVLLFAVMIGCQSGTDDPESDRAPFAEADWVFYNEVSAEHDRIFFGEDGSFSYHCDCGEPVGDSDIYELYRYNDEELTITLYNNYDDSEKIVKLLSYNVSHLLLEIDGVIRDFTTVETDTRSNFWQEQAESYLSGYEMTRTLIKFTENGVMTAAVNYDTETQYPKGTLEEFALAEDVIYSDLSLFSQMKVEDDVESEVNYDVAFTELTREDMNYYLENGGATSYLWLNDEMEIEKAVVFGMTTVIE